MLNKILLVIPTFNEEKNIILITNKLLKLNKNIKILVIDDSISKPNRPKKLKKKVSFIQRKNKKGRCSAVLDGFKIGLKKNFNIFIEMDADFSHNPHELNRNIKYFKNQKLDLLISSRYLKKSKIINWSLSRKVLSYLSNFLADLLLSANLTDYTNGYRIYSKDSVSIITKNCGLISNSFITLSDIIITLKNRDKKIDEIHSIFVNRVRGDSKVNFLMVLSSLFGLFKLFIYKKIFKF